MPGALSAMNCTQCGAETSIESVYCPKCGHRLDSSSDEPKTAGQTPEVEQPNSPAEQFRERLSPGGPTRDDPETDIWEGGYSPKAMIGTWVGIALVTLIGLIVVATYSKTGTWWTIFLLTAVVLWGGGFLCLMYRKWSAHYRLTSQRFFHRSGLLRRVTDRIEVIDMDDIAFEQGLIERMVGVGTIKITSSDRTHPVLDLPGIDHVAEVCEEIDVARRAERIRRGVHIESV
jgi:membrane protein YdbS with pleckstrin-like domain